MSLIECHECGKQISHTANICPSCGFDLSRHYGEWADSQLGILTVVPIISYFVVILGGIHLGIFDTDHKFFHTAIFNIPILNWLWIPNLIILGGVPVFKHVWWGGWTGAIFMVCAAIFAVNAVAPELLPV